MKWEIPAKTFLLGEYAALAESSAIVLTTTPYFELSLIDGEEELIGIHPEAPAAVFWRQKKHKGKSLVWKDPYKACGGLGASSAQFLASYLAHCTLQNIPPNLNSMLSSYYQSSWSGIGLRPSGYDVIAQSQHGCVYINKQQQTILSYKWPFKDLSCLLFHTGIKLTTHHHLQTTALPSSINQLTAIVEEAKLAFEQGNSEGLIQSINNYHDKLQQLNLVAPHSLKLIQRIKIHSEVLAIKGCGALGADLILILTATKDVPKLCKKLFLEQTTLLATEQNINLLNKNPIFTNDLH